MEVQYNTHGYHITPHINYKGGRVSGITYIIRIYDVSCDKHNNIMMNIVSSLIYGWILENPVVILLLNNVID